MAKKSDAPVDDLPSAEEATVETAAGDAAGDAGDSVESSLPLFQVTSPGLDSASFHAVDESDAIRQFYKHHKITDTASRSHRAVRVSG